MSAWVAIQGTCQLALAFAMLGWFLNLLQMATWPRSTWFTRYSIITMFCIALTAVAHEQWLYAGMGTGIALYWIVSLSQQPAEPELTPEQEACDQATHRINTWLHGLPAAERDRILAGVQASARDKARSIRELTE